MDDQMSDNGQLSNLEDIDVPMDSESNNEHAADLRGRPSLKELVLADDEPKKSGGSEAIEPYNDGLQNKATTSSSFFGNVNYDSALIKNCISRISDINAI